MTDPKVVSSDAMVDRFLSWPLPDSVCPDRATNDPNRLSGKYRPLTGTNLLTADEARAMLTHVLAAAPKQDAGAVDARMAVGDPRNPFRDPLIADGYAAGWNARAAIAPPAAAPQPSPARQLVHDVCAAYVAGELPELGDAAPQQGDGVARIISAMDDQIAMLARDPDATDAAIGQTLQHYRGMLAATQQPSGGETP
jgi:hypothetical protein